MQRTVVVGDIHGCFDELLDLLGKVELGPDDLLVNVGDVVDRGPAPGEVVEFLRTRPNTVVVMGNHERKHVRGIFSPSQEITRLQLGDRYGDAVEWMRTLPYYFENDHVRVVHAALVPGVALADQREEILCGSTSGERKLAALFPDSRWYDHYDDARPVAFGHHVVGREPLVRAGRIFGLDTGACHGGNLTALCLPEAALHAVPARTDHWLAVRRRWQLPVLKARPWRELSWRRLAEEVARFSAEPDPATRDWIDRVEAWAGQLRSAFPALAAAAQRVAGELTADEIRPHPAAPLLFQARRGRLDQAVLAGWCGTPGRTIDLAAALGLSLPEPPA